MSCFKKDGIIKKIYMDLVPLIESAKPFHNVIVVDDTPYDYSCRRFILAKNKEKHIGQLLDELGIGYKIWADSKDTIAVDIINSAEVLEVVRRAN